MLATNRKKVHMSDPTYAPPVTPAPKAPRTAATFTQVVAALAAAVVVTILAVFLIVSVEKPAPTPAPKPTRNIAQEWTACMYNQNTTSVECNKIVQNNVPADTYIAFSQCVSQGTDAASYLLCIQILPTNVVTA